MAKLPKITVDDIGINEANIDMNMDNPLYASVFNQPAVVKQEEQLCDVLLDQLHDFPNHPFKVRNDETMIELRDSIIAHGLLSPIMVRPRAEGGYTIIAGHRRVAACKKAGLSNIRAVVKNLTDDQAIIAMVDSNMQREEVLPSEKAFAYKMKLDAMKRVSGYRSDLKELTSSQVGTRLRSDEIMANEIGESRNQIQRYIRLTYLIPQLLDEVDDKTIAFNPAVELSYLRPDEQQYLYETIKTLDRTPSLAQAQELKRFSARNELTQTKVMEMLVVDKPNQKSTIKVDAVRLSTYLSHVVTQAPTKKEMEEAQNELYDRLDSFKDIENMIRKYSKQDNLTPEQVKKGVEAMVRQFTKGKNKEQSR